MSGAVRARLFGEWGVIGSMAALRLVVHIRTIRGYGYFRDEFYYVACGRHLDWGYVDHPPFVALVAWIVSDTLGDSLVALRLLPALAGAPVVLLAGLMARRLGGGRFAQALAGLAVTVAPVSLSLHHIFSMNAFEQVFWALGAYLVLRILQDDDPRLWLAFGLLAGLGLQNKHSMLFFGFGIAAGLLLTPARKHLRSPWLWAGGALALLLFLPNLVWQVQHGWPTLDFMRNAQERKITPLPALTFLQAQLLQMQPLSAPLWLAGLGFLVLSARGRRYAALGWAFLAILAVFLAQRAKPYYLAPAYPMLFAAGAVAAEGLAARRGWAWLRPAALVLLALGGAATVPLAIPALPVDAYVVYARALGVKPGTDERHALRRLPQFFADMFGWPEMVAEVARAWQELTPEERARTVIFASNYGEAGAIDLLGRRYGLPPTRSGHNSYWLWGPGSDPGPDWIVLTVGESREDVEKTFGDVREVGRTRCAECMPYEDARPIYLGRQPRLGLREVWPLVKDYI